MFSRNLIDNAIFPVQSQCRVYPNNNLLLFAHTHFQISSLQGFLLCCEDSWKLKINVFHIYNFHCEVFSFPSSVCRWGMIVSCGLLYACLQVCIYLMASQSYNGFNNITLCRAQSLNESFTILSYTQLLNTISMCNVLMRDKCDLLKTSIRGVQVYFITICNQARMCSHPSFLAGLSLFFGSFSK